MKQVIEVTGHEFIYDKTATYSENAAMKELFCISVAEWKKIIYEFECVIKACGLTDRVELLDYGYYFYVKGFIPDDVMAMFEDILLEYTNDVVDKVDYAIGEID